MQYKSAFVYLCIPFPHTPPSPSPPTASVCPCFVCIVHNHNKLFQTLCHKHLLDIPSESTVSRERLVGWLDPGLTCVLLNLKQPKLGAEVPSNCQLEKNYYLILWMVALHGRLLATSLNSTNHSPQSQGQGCLANWFGMSYQQAIRSLAM